MKNEAYFHKISWPASRLLSALAVVMILLAACAPQLPEPVAADDPPLSATLLTQQAESQTAEKVVEMVAETDTTGSSGSQASAEEWQTITPPGDPMSFELPAGWQHYGQDTNWSPDEGKTLIGLRMGWNQPGKEIEAGLLPEDAVVQSAETIMVGTTSIRRFTVLASRRVPDPQNDGQFLKVPSVEQHNLYVRPDSMVFDFFIAAETEEALAGLAPVMQHLLESLKFEG